MTAIVFAGPSIYGFDAALLGDIEIRPPAACGDILLACRDNAARIGLIDGIFESGPSAWHKEILFALSAGIEVFGAASMGALRAAECHHFGMQGVGSIFEQYRSGRRSADSDVAVLHAPPELDHRPLTVALVDVDATISRPSVSALLTPKEAASLSDAATKMHFKERTWPRVLEAAQIVGPRRDAVLDAVRSHGVSQKAIDAKELILRVKAGDIQDPAPPRMASADLNRTVYFDALQRRVQSRPRI
jgi:hypothetical protein